MILHILSLAEIFLDQLQLCDDQSDKEKVSCTTPVAPSLLGGLQKMYGMVQFSLQIFSLVKIKITVTNFLVTFGSLFIVILIISLFCEMITVTSVLCLTPTKLLIQCCCLPYRRDRSPKCCTEEECPRSQSPGDDTSELLSYT